MSHETLVIKQGKDVWNAWRTANPDIVPFLRSAPLEGFNLLEVAQFIYVLLNHQKLRGFFNTTTQRCVLILGRFGGGGLEVLQAVADHLRSLAYLPIIFDFERPQQRNLTELMVILQLVLAPVHPPVQPPKVLLLSAFAVRVTTVPSA